MTKRAFGTYCHQLRPSGLFVACVVETFFRGGWANNQDSIMRTVKRVANYSAASRGTENVVPSVASHRLGNPTSLGTKLVSLQIHPDGRTSKDLQNHQAGHISQRMDPHIGPLMRRHGARKSQQSAISTSSSGDVEVFDLGLAATENATVFPATHFAKTDPTEPGRQTEIESSIQIRSDRKQVPATPPVKQSIAPVAPVAIAPVAPVAISPAAPVATVAPVTMQPQIPATLPVAPAVVASPAEQTPSITHSFVNMLLVAMIIILMIIILSSVVRRRRDVQFHHTTRDVGNYAKRRNNQSFIASSSIPNRRRTSSAPPLTLTGDGTGDEDGSSAAESSTATPSASLPTRIASEPRQREVEPASPVSVIAGSTFRYKKSRPSQLFTGIPGRRATVTGMNDANNDDVSQFGSNPQAKSSARLTPQSAQSARQPRPFKGSRKVESPPLVEINPETTDVMEPMSFDGDEGSADLLGTPSFSQTSALTSNPKNPRRKGKEEVEYEYDV